MPMTTSEVRDCRHEIEAMVESLRRMRRLLEERKILTVASDIADALIDLDRAHGGLGRLTSNV